MNDIRISIIIPAYNEARTLGACLDAIASQTAKPYEVIVVDNNSIDGTVTVARRYAFVRVIHEPKQGVAFARNAGFNATRGNIIARIDADARLPADWVEHLTEFYSLPGREMSVFTGGCRFYNLRTGYLTGRMYDLIVHRFNALILGYYFPWGSNSALPAKGWRSVRRDVINAANIHEDLDLGIHLQAAGYRTVYQPWVRVPVMAKRIMENRGQLWPYAAMWPRTFRANGLRVWSLVWPFAVLVWLGGYWILFIEHATKVFSVSRDVGK